MLRSLTEPRHQLAFGPAEKIVLAIYTLILAVAVPFHEPWADEAQAWLIARDSSLRDLFLVRLHYEGHPGLWHFILWVAVHLHLPYSSLGWISAAFSVGGTYIFLRRSPFPFLPRILLPFTFFFLYQHAVIARSYSAIPVLLFSLLVVFRLEKPTPLLFALLAGLLANLSLYTLLWSFAMALLYLPVLRSSSRRISPGPTLAAGAIFCSMTLFAVYTALPAADIGTPPLVEHYAQGHPSMKKYLPDTPLPQGWDERGGPDLSLEGRIIFPAEPDIHLRGNLLQRAIIRIEHPSDPSYPAQTFGHRLTALMLPLSGLLFSISASNLLAIAFLAVAAFWLHQRHCFRFALPLIPLLLFGAVGLLYEHHTGLFFLALIASSWLAWSTPTQPLPGSAVVGTIFSLLLSTVLAEQVLWSAFSVVSDMRKPYDPAPATARYLQRYARGLRLAAFDYHTVSLTPYLGPHPFENQPRSYWLWSRHYPVFEHMPVELALRPDVLIVSRQKRGDQLVANQITPELVPGKVFDALPPEYLATFGYFQKTLFCGDMFFRNGVSSTNCNVLYTRDASILP